MPHATPPTPHTVHATLNFHLDVSKGGSDTFHAGTVGANRRKHAPVEVPIVDIRGHEDDFSLDVQGFELVRDTTTALKGEDFLDDERVKTEYYRECAELVKARTGATFVKPGQHVLRRANWHAAAEADKDLPDEARSTPANARYVHVDQSTVGALARMQQAMGAEEAERLGKSRWALINIWRPLAPVTRDALAVTDARSVPDDCLTETMMLFGPSEAVARNLPSDHPYGAYGESFNNAAWEVLPPVPEDRYRWHYASAMQPDEALLLKIYDSSVREGVARRSPHTSFDCEEDYGPVRESVEVRCLVFWDNEE